MKRILQITVIALLTILFLGLFLWNADLSQVWTILRSTSVPWLIVALIVNLSALFFRTARWRILLDPDKPPPWYPTFFANTVGYMLSSILPIRAADVARPALLARRTDFRFSGVLGTVLTERVLDLLAILLLFLYFSALRWNEFSHSRSFFIVRIGAITTAILFVVMLGFIVGIWFFSGGIRRAHEFLGRFIPKRFRDSWMHFFDTFVETIEIARHRSAFAKVLFCTAGVWACLTGQFYFTVLALHRPLPYDASIFVTGITTIGLAIPTPGGVGGFHKACQLVLTHFYQFDVDSSVAVAVLFHLVGTLPVLLTGLLLFVKEGLHWRDVRRASSE